MPINLRDTRKSRVLAAVTAALVIQLERREPTDGQEPPTVPCRRTQRTREYASGFWRTSVRTLTDESRYGSRFFRHAVVVWTRSGRRVLLLWAGPSETRKRLEQDYILFRGSVLSSRFVRSERDETRRYDLHCSEPAMSCTGCVPQTFVIARKALRMLSVCSAYQRILMA